MNNRPAGSWIEDENGDLTPNLNDEAMAARQQMGTGDQGQAAGSGSPSSAEEVKTNE